MDCPSCVRFATILPEKVLRRPLTCFHALRTHAALRRHGVGEKHGPRDADINRKTPRDRRWRRAIERCAFGSCERFTLSGLAVRLDGPSRAECSGGFLFASAR